MTTPVWTTEPSPSSTISTASPGFWATPDGNNIVLNASTYSSTLRQLVTSLQIYGTDWTTHEPGEAWGPVITIPNASLFSSSPIYNGSIVAENASNGLFSVVVDPSKAIGTVTTYNADIQDMATAFAMPGPPQSGLWSAFNMCFWFPTLPGLIAWVMGDTNYPHATWALVFFTIDTLEVAGLLVGNFNAGTPTGSGNAFGQGGGGSFGFWQGLMPLGNIYAMEDISEWVATAYGNIASLLPANCFEGAATTTITWGNFTDPTVVNNVPAIHMTQFNAAGVLAPTALDTFQQNLITATQQANGPIGASSYATASTTAPYPITMQPFDLSTETLGSSVTLDLPTGWTSSFLAVAFNGTAYALDTTGNTFIKMTGITPPVTHPSVTIADLWFSQTQGFVDLTVASNRRNFFSVDGGAQSLASDGSAPFGVTPPVFLTNTGMPASFGTNAGRGGAFIASGGTLAAGGSDPLLSSETTTTVQENSAGNGVLGDYASGNLYAFNPRTLTDNGAPRRWLRRWRALPQTALGAKRFGSLVIQVQTGIGVPDGDKPQIVLRWSDDGGKSWSNERIQAAGQLGATAQTLKFNRLGATRRFGRPDRIFELSSSDPFLTAIIDAEVDVS